MASFGPFINETIDFRNVEDKGIFLITGDTGSGKTTIFDAICVALFGESNGDERTVESFKSDFEGADEVMKIEFTFELRSKVYRIVRVPKQMRKKFKGEGFTEDSGSVTLFEVRNNEETAVDFSKDANAKIQELIGLNAKQFRQIVMIPQGQFRKLITESSDEREKILRSIFDVYKYEQFQKHLDVVNLSLKNSIQDYKNILNSEVAHIKCDESSALYSAIQSEDKNISWIIDEAKRIVEEDKNIKQILIQELEDNKEKKNATERQLTRVKQNNSLLDEYEKLQNEKRDLEQKEAYFEANKVIVEMASRAYRIFPIEEHLKQRKQEIILQEDFLKSKSLEKLQLEDKLKVKEEEFNRLSCNENIDKLTKYKQQEMFYNSMLPKVIEYEGLKSSVDGLLLKYEEEENTIKVLQETIINQQEDYKKILKEKEMINLCSIQQEKVSKIISDLNNKLEILMQLNKCSVAYRDAYKRHLHSKESFQNVTEVKVEANKHYDLQRKHWFEGQAGILAQGLKEGDSCPVCGNIHHLKLAIVQEDIPTKETLDNLSEKLAKIEEQFNKLQICYAADQQNNSNKRELLEEAIHDIKNSFEIDLSFDTDDIQVFYSQKIEELRELISKNHLEQNHIKHQLLALESIGERLEKSSKHKENLEDQLRSLQTNHFILLEEKTVKESQLKVIQKELPQHLHSEKNLVEQINIIKEKISQIESHMEAVKNSRDEIKGYLLTLRGIIVEGEKSLEDKVNLYERVCLDFEKALIMNAFINREHYEEMKIDELRINLLRDELIEFEQRKRGNLQELLQLSEAIKGLEKEDVQVLENQILYLYNKVEEVTKQLTLIEVRIEENLKQISKIEKQYGEYKKIEVEQAVVNDLSSVANGSSKGAARITFERYILSAFLQEVVSAANIRLHKMSNTRYELVRSLGSDKRKNSGLDLEVFDYYTGKARDINTLSGGEGFKAALSLALGLADIAQAYAGGISLDTMFVDEGFGSLSAESLDNAINCLMDLKEGGRLVGIISHVQELKDRIDTRLVVEKSKTGSIAYFEGIC